MQTLTLNPPHIVDTLADILIITHSIDNLLKVSKHSKIFPFWTSPRKLPSVTKYILSMYMSMPPTPICTAEYSRNQFTPVYNYNSECPHKNKDSTINAQIHRTYKIYSNCDLLNSIPYRNQDPTTSFCQEFLPKPPLKKLNRCLRKLNTDDLRKRTEIEPSDPPTSPLPRTLLPSPHNS